MNNDLKKLYTTSSKHSNYQMLSTRVRELIGAEDLNINSRYEKERLDYIASNVEINGKHVLDIGGNTGYFTFEVIDFGAKEVNYYEGNKVHADFVKKVVDLTDLNNKVKVSEEYYLFDKYEQRYDVALLLNVIHHLGDDFGNEDDVSAAKILMLKSINQMSAVSKYLVFQMGYNWCGDRTKCLFENGTKREMIDFIVNGTKEEWEVVKIGIAVGTKENIHYEDLNDINIKREDSVGEFLNRPIFIMRSKKL